MSSTDEALAAPRATPDATTPVPRRGRRRRWWSLLVVPVVVGAVIVAASSGGERVLSTSAAATAGRIDAAVTASRTASRTTQLPNDVPRYNCITAPSRCGYPDATTTGARGSLVRIPQDATSGPGWTYDQRGFVDLNTSGATFANYQCQCILIVSADNVTIQNVRLEVGGETMGIQITHASGVTVADSTIGWSGAASGRLMVGIMSIEDDNTDLRVLRNDIFGTSTAVQTGQGLIQDNYIHDLKLKLGDHLNGITSNGTTSNQLTIRHNTVLNSYEQTDAIGLFQDFGMETNRLIEDNLLGGGTYTIYAGSNTGMSPATNIVVRNNRFVRTYFPLGGLYGPVANFDLRGSGNKFTGNVWDDDGTPVRL